MVIDPIGTLPVFYFATAGVPERLHRRIAVRAVAVAVAVAVAKLVLLSFLVAGQVLPEGLGLHFGSFQIAGGIVLFLFALTMIFGDGKLAREIEEAERDHLGGAIFPLAMPSIASPSAMLAIVVLIDNHRNSLAGQAVTAALPLVVFALAAGLLLLGARLKRATGANVISRVMGIVLATVAMDAVLGGRGGRGAAAPRP